MSMPGVISGVTMVFVPAVSTFIISKMLGGGGNLLIGDLIDMQFSARRITRTSALPFHLSSWSSFSSAWAS